MPINPRCYGAERRSGATAVLVAVALVVLIGFAALAVDVGHLCVAKAELQNAADAAALAGASAFVDHSIGAAGDAVIDPDLYTATVTEAVTNRAVDYAARNFTTGVATGVEDGDMIVGQFDFETPTAALIQNGIPNAVRVTARFTEDSQNGPVASFFASILGFKNSDVSATATAALDDRFVGYEPDYKGLLLPFTLHIDIFEDQVANGPDNFTYDPDLDVVKDVGDGIREVHLYPYPDEEGGEGAGNFGLLNVGTLNQGADALEQQILNGITPEDLEAEIGTSKIAFADEAGNPVTHKITGSPGVKVGLEPAVEARVGDLIAFLLHDTIVLGGSNAVYTIVQLRFGRIMDVQLTGPQAERTISVQPVTYSDGGVFTDPDAPDSDRLVGNVVLVR